MLDFPRWKVWSIWLVVAACILLSVPSLISGTTLAGRYPAWLPQYKINLGLDLAGGSHLLYEADARDAQKQRLQTMEDAVTTELRRSPRIEIGDVSTVGGRVALMVRNPAQVDAAVTRLRQMTQPSGLTGTRDWNVAVVNSTGIVLTPTASGSAQAMKNAMTAARDVVRRRIDPGGTKEITVITQGGNRLLVQVPGVEDPEALKALIGQTARLEFKLVDQSANPDDVQQGRAPPGSHVLPMADGTGFIAVKRRVMVSGEQLTDAKQGYDQDNRAVVDITFNSSGARRFGRVTQENVNKPFAIILDDKVLSAPNINEPILGGRAQISGNFTVQTANDLAVSLASGQLPVKLNVIEERTVSAELGRDSIRKGAIASVAATIVVMLFMLITYGRFGVYANIALVVNALMILGIMSLFNATLTLPGIAGFVLTIGAAVDANVLTNERIREEIRRGRKTIDALETGYKEASTAIFDANITNTIAAALMILGIMALFNATLTLPGIAGFVLTIGAAVDANVLMNERIREEIRRGRKTIDALETGYKEASTAIFDANITNTIAAALMMYFGSGPIRGFAVVLLIGIVTSVFTAVNFTRMLVAQWVRRTRPKQLNI